VFCFFVCFGLVCMSLVLIVFGSFSFHGVFRLLGGKGGWGGGGNKMLFFCSGSDGAAAIAHMLNCKGNMTWE
jgi:hypothetical protein